MSSASDLRDICVRFDRDMTMRWPCVSGDYILWARCIDPFRSGRDAWTICDYWELCDGDHVLVTNRACDTPAGVEDSETDAMNVWHLKVGDRLAWSGRPRTAGRDGKDQPILLGLVECWEPAIAFGDSNQPPFHPDFGAFLFGEPSTEEPSPYARAAGQLAFDAVVALGLPRNLEL